MSGEPLETLKCVIRCALGPCSTYQWLVTHHQSTYLPLHTTSHIFTRWYAFANRTQRNKNRVIWSRFERATAQTVPEGPPG